MSDLVTSAIVAIGASVASGFAKTLVTRFSDLPIFRARRRLVTLTGGKSEYLAPRGLSPDDYVESLRHYLRFEETVRSALELALGQEIVTRSFPDRADFAIGHGPHPILVEAKTHPEAVSERELRDLLEAEDAKLIFFVTPQAMPRKLASRFDGLVQTGLVRLIHATDREDLTAKFKAAFQILE